jgi:polar amino acid transport system substrate-binding protein
VSQTAIRFAAAAVLAFVLRPLAAEELRLAANEWPPYTFADVYRQGVATALVTAGLERAGYTSRVTIMAWPKVLDTTRRGDNDVIIAAWFREERNAELAFSQPYLTNELEFLTRDDVQVRELSREALAGYRIGVVEDFAYGEQPYDTTGLDIVVGATVRDNVRALFARELDLVLGDERILRHEVDLVSGAKFVSFVPEPLETRGLRIAVSRARDDHADIVAAFDAAISAMREDGSYNSVLANYRISD